MKYEVASTGPTYSNNIEFGSFKSGNFLPFTIKEFCWEDDDFGWTSEHIDRKFFMPFTHAISKPSPFEREILKFFLSSYLDILFDWMVLLGVVMHSPHLFLWRFFINIWNCKWQIFYTYNVVKEIVYIN